jgi:tRNA splicing endonuclease
MHVTLPKEDAERLYRRFGAGDGERVHVIELRYFAERGILDVPYEEAFEQFKREDEFAEEKYAVFKFLRSRGYITKVLEGPFLLGYRKGFRPGEDRSSYLIKIVRGVIDEDTLKQDVAKAVSMRKELIYCFINHEVRFFRVESKRFP